MACPAAEKCGTSEVAVKHLHLHSAGGTNRENYEGQFSDLVQS